MSDTKASARAQLPSLEEVRKGIDELLVIDNWDDYKIKSSPKRFAKRFDKLFFSKFKIIPHVIILSNQNTFTFKFYRLRKATKHLNSGLISEYSYPPNHVVKSIQRANIPYHPVFYCSDNPVTAIYETVKDDEVNPDVSYYLSEWQFRLDVNVRICPFVYGSVDESNPYKVFSDVGYQKVREKMTEHSDEEVKAFYEILTFLSRLFTYDNTYVVSSYIAHSNLYAPHDLRPDVFIYPSTQTDRKTVNFAIHPNSVAEKLVFNRVFKLKVTSVDKAEGSCGISITHVGENKEGIIHWGIPDDTTDTGKRLVKILQQVFGKKGESVRKAKSKL